MHILLINHYAGGAKHGMEYRPYFMAKRWVEMGHKVTIVASSFSHLRTKNPSMEGKKLLEEDVDGIRYVWLNGNSYEGNGVGRIRNMLSFLGGLNTHAAQIAGEDRPNVVIASSTYPLDIYPARKIAKKYGAMLIYEVHDLWPLSPIELGGMSPKHPYIQVMQKAENDCCKYSDYIVSLLPCSKEHFIEHGMAPEKFVCIPNGIVKADWDAPFHDPAVYSDKLGAYHADGWFLIGYTGAHGIANALDSFVEAGERLRGKKIKLIAVGQGPERDRLMRKVQELHVEENVEFLPAVKRDEVPELLAQFDALYVGLQRQPLFRFGVSPNKLMDYMMAGKPVIFAIDAGNDMVAEAGCGVSIPPEDSAAIAKAAEQLAASSKEELAAMGERGHRFILENYEYDVLAKKFIDVFESPYKAKK